MFSHIKQTNIKFDFAIGYSYCDFRFGLLGNHPFRTRSRCSKSSNIDQKQEKLMIPKIAERYVFSDSKEAAQPTIPITKKTGQQRTPK